MVEKMLLIDLALCNNIIGLILKSPSGVQYSNQTDGCACHHPLQEGVFVPFEEATDVLVGTFCEELQENFNDPSGNLVKVFNDKFKKLGLPLAVDVHNLHNSEEAWVHVIITDEVKKPEFSYSPLAELTFKEAILVYPNSD